VELAFHKNGKGSGRVPRGSLAATIGRAQAVAPDAIDTEDGRPGTSLADVLFRHADLQKGKVRQFIGQPRLAMVVGRNVVMPHRKMEVAPVIARIQAQMGMGDWLPVRAIENADGDDVVVDHRKVLIRATHLSGVKEHRRGEIKSEREDGKLRSEVPNSAADNLRRLPIVLHPGHA